MNAARRGSAGRFFLASGPARLLDREDADLAGSEGDVGDRHAVEVGPGIGAAIEVPLAFI